MVVNPLPMQETQEKCFPGLERSPGVGNSNSLQYSCLENAMDSGAWWATVHRITKSWTPPSKRVRAWVRAHTDTRTWMRLSVNLDLCMKKWLPTQMSAWKMKYLDDIFFWCSESEPFSCSNLTGGVVTNRLCESYTGRTVCEPHNVFRPKIRSK